MASVVRSRAQTSGVREAHFVVSASLLEELGERLVSKPEIALAELIKNGYDADATICTISIDPTKIVVTDTGHGMTEAEFQRNWMVVSSQEKGKQRYSRRYGRGMAGSKGVGRFSARYLGDVLTMITVADDAGLGERTQLRATFNWSAIAKASRISDVTISYSLETVSEDVPTGTTLEISELRTEARSIVAAAVKSDILRLTDPAAGLEVPPFLKRRARSADQEHDPGFVVRFATSETDGDGEPTDLAEQVLSAYVGRVRLEVKESGAISYEVFWRGRAEPVGAGQLNLAQVASGLTLEELLEAPGAKRDPRGFPEAFAPIKHLPLAKRLHSPAFIDLRFFPRRKGTFSGLGVNGKSAEQWLHAHAGLAIVDNNFTMASYADADSDWLGIDESKAHNERDWQSVITPIIHPMAAAEKRDPARNPMLALPRGNQIIGRVHIATHKDASDTARRSDDWLAPNMDRESLHANAAFNTLWQIARFAAELIAHFDRKIRLEESRRAEKVRRQNTRAELQAAIRDIRTSKAIEPEFRHRIVQQLQVLETRIEESAEYLREQQVSLEIMSMMGVMAGFMTHEFEKAMGQLKQAAVDISKIAKSRSELAPLARDILKSEMYLSNYLDYMRLFISKARDHRAQDFKAASQIRLVTKTLAAISDSHHIVTEVDVDAKLPGPVVPLAAYNGIVTNLITNAMKALVARTGSEPKTIRLYATNDSTRHTLVCMDNGIGIADYLRPRIWDPLFTTTADDNNPLGSGMGLGLALVKEVVGRLSGKIELMDRAPPGFTTAFRVVLPLSGSV